MFRPFDCQGWEDLQRLITIKRQDGEPSPLHLVADQVEQNEAAWRDYYDLEAPEEVPLPVDFSNDLLTAFEKLCLLR